MHSFIVKNMSCGHCVSTISKAIKDVDTQAEVTFDLGKRHIEVASDKSSEIIAAALSQAGYPGELSKKE